VIISFGQMVFWSLHRIRTVDYETGPAVNETAASVSGAEKAVLQPVDYYKERVKKRNVFRMGQKTNFEATEVISAKAAEAAQSLKLVGISWSDQPDAMIEDTKAGKTYFVKKGQLVGDLKVETVYRDRVILRFGAETIELR
jgi:hypothetical protein